MLARITAALAAVPLAGTAALAGDIPGDASTKAVLRVSNVGTEDLFETAHDSDWYRVRMTRGQDYAVKLGLGYVQGWLTLRDAARRPLGTTANYGDRDAGFEVRAPYTGTYFVEVKGEWYTPAEANDYLVAVVHDCKDGLDTRCALVPGETYHYGSAWIRDYDVYAAVLDRSKRYTFTGTVPPPGICALRLELLDGTGRVLVGPTYSDIKGYKPPRSGTYYLRANCNSDDYGGKYDLLLTVR